MPISKNQMKSVSKYKSGHYYAPAVNILAEYREPLQKIAAENGTSLNVYINQLIKKDLASRGIEYHFPGEPSSENGD